MSVKKKEVCRVQCALEFVFIQNQNGSNLDSRIRNKWHAIIAVIMINSAIVCELCRVRDIL